VRACRPLIAAIVCLLSSPDTTRPPGGWKWMPFGASARKSPVKRLEATPYARRKTRVNASSDAYPAPNADVGRGCATSQFERRTFEQQAAPECRGRLAQNRRREAVEVEAAQARAAREVGAGTRVVDVDENVDDAAEPSCMPSILARGRPVRLIVLAE